MSDQVRIEDAILTDAILTILNHELFNRNTGLSVTHNVARAIYKLEDGRIAVSVFDINGRKEMVENLFTDDRVAVQRFIDLVIEAEK